MYIQKLKVLQNKVLCISIIFFFLVDDTGGAFIPKAGEKKLPVSSKNYAKEECMLYIYFNCILFDR